MGISVGFRNGSQDGGPTGRLWLCSRMSSQGAVELELDLIHENPIRSMGPAYFTLVEVFGVQRLEAVGFMNRSESPNSQFGSSPIPTSWEVSTRRRTETRATCCIVVDSWFFGWQASWRGQMMKLVQFRQH